MANDQIAKPLIVEIEGDHYEFTPLKLPDISGPVTDYFKLEPVAALLKQRDAFDAEVFGELMSEVKDGVKGIELGTVAFNEELVKPKNLVYMFWLSIRKKHPEMKKKAFEDMLLKDEDAARTLFGSISRIIALSDSSPKREDAPTRKDTEGAKKKTDPST
jgi:hypothetical protein